LTGRPKIDPGKIDPGLCGSCRHAQVVRSDRGSVFYRCLLAATDARFQKYPALPVIACEGYERDSGRQPK
jgi:hypothetical protein